MEITSGVHADATLVSRLVGGRYTSWPKEVVRRRILRGFRDVDPTLVMDMWGGGGSARALTEAGFAVLSVDDGRAFGDHGVVLERGQRALSVLGEIDGYRTAFGDVMDHCAYADAAFLDFMGHWAPDKKRVLVACRHMKAVAVTLMPERTPLGRLDDEDWRLAYGALLESALQMRVRWVHTYRRNDHNQQATVYFLRPAKHGRRHVPERPCMDCGGSLRNLPPQTRRCVTCKREHERIRHQTPAAQATARKARERWRVDHPSSERPRARIDEDLRKRRERYAADPEYREEMKRRAREYARRKKLAAVSGTTAEAVSTELAA